MSTEDRTDSGWLTGPEVAGQLGIKPGSLRTRWRRGHFPPPDDPDEGTTPNRRSPRWREETVTRYLRRRAAKRALADAGKKLDGPATRTEDGSSPNAT